MSFNKNMRVIKKAFCVPILLAFIAHSYDKKAKDTQSNTEKQDSKKHDYFVDSILLQDTTNILDSSLPLPYFSLPYTQTHRYLKRKNSTRDSIFDEVMKQIKPRITTYDYSQLKNMDTTRDEESIDFKIHELEKESYMLKSQLIEKEKRKRNWLINPDASGYYVGIGVMLGSIHNGQSFGIGANRVGTGGNIRLGYLRYFYNHLGLKAELFNIYGNYTYDDKLFLYNYYGLRLVVLHDMPVFFEGHSFGFFAGFGVGGYILSKKYQSAHYNDSTNTHDMSLNLNMGISWTYIKHHRVEIERIFMSNLTAFSNDVKNIFEPSYVVSYSWVF